MVIVTVLALVSAPAMATTVTSGPSATEPTAMSGDSPDAVTVDELTLTGASFALDVEDVDLDGLIVGGRHVELGLEDASLHLEDATVTIEDATIHEDGTITMAEGSMTIERGTLAIESGTVSTEHGFSMDVEDRTIVVGDVSRSAEDVSGDVFAVFSAPVTMVSDELSISESAAREAFSSASIESATVSGVDASVAVEELGLDGGSLSEVGSAVEDATVTVDDAAVDDGEGTIEGLRIELGDGVDSTTRHVLRSLERSSMVDDVSVSEDGQHVVIEDVRVTRDELLVLLGIET